MPLYNLLVSLLGQKTRILRISVCFCQLPSDVKLRLLICITNLSGEEAISALCTTTSLCRILSSNCTRFSKVMNEQRCGDFICIKGTISCLESENPVSTELDYQWLQRHSESPFMDAVWTNMSCWI